MKNKLQTIIVSVALMTAGAAWTASAAPKTSPSASASPHASPATSAAAPNETTTARAIPFHGTISAVDQKAKTFTIAGKEKSRVFKVTDKTVITRNGAPATSKDLTANEEVSGSYWKAADGSLEAKTVKVGPKAETPKTSETKTSKKKADASASPSVSPKP